MTDDRRMTTDRFYGGVSNRLQNLRSMLVYVRDEHPTREKLNRWVIDNTRAGSPDAVRHHLSFLDSIEVVELSDTRCEPGTYGQGWLDDQDPKTLYEALSSGVKGFDTILDALQEGEMTDEDIMDLLVGKFDEAEMSKPGPAARHREWLQVLGFVERDDGVNRLTAEGHELLGKTTEGGSDSTGGPSVESNEAPRGAIETERERLEDALDEEPQLTDECEYTATRRRVRDTAFSEAVRQTYNESCAICGTSRETPDGAPEVEAAHIFPKREGGADDVRNGVALCKLHHWAFDTGWLAISDDYEILVQDASERDGYDEFTQLKGDTLDLPDNDKARPHRMFLERHRAIHGF